MTELLAAAFMAGLGSPHCASMCGGFASACSTSWRSSLGWHAGRLTTYATLGAAAGSLGHLLPGPAWIPFAISALLLVWFALVLAGAAPYVRPIPGLARISSRFLTRTDVASRYFFGITTGLLPCGLVDAALGFAVAAGSAAVGALAMLAFGLATVPVLAFLGGLANRIAMRGIWHRRALAVVILLVGLWSLASRTAAMQLSH
ncbi:MAG TPA: sulfite exporter TauE/SafE family protein [Longimicrobiales bacterium]